MKQLFSHSLTDLTELSDYLEPLKVYIRNHSNEGDVFLVQGDFARCFEMVNFIKSLGFMAVHSTTKRDTIEKMVNDKAENFSRFEHVIFRRY